MKNLFVAFVLICGIYAVGALGQGVASAAPSGKILVAYFSWAGNTKHVAENIAARVGGDLFEIAPSTPYTKDYDSVLEVAKQEQYEGRLPSLAANVENLSDYNVVFLGYPIWWYDAPQIIKSFMATHDLSGKTVIPFCTSGGSDLSESMNSIRQGCPNSEIAEGLTANSESDIEPWLARLGF